MFTFESLEPPTLGLRGLEADLSEEELAIQQMAHRFANEVMRPLGEKLDKMTPDQVVTYGSPLYEYLEKIRQSGILDLEGLARMDKRQQSRIFPLIFGNIQGCSRELKLLLLKLQNIAVASVRQL